MAWIQVFPTGPTLISQSVAQFQANWLFLQNNINTDHYFNDVAHEGHHRFSQYFNPGGDPALAADGVVYTKNMGNVVVTPQPFFQNSTNIRQIGTIWTGVQIFGSAGTFPIFNCAGQAPFYGWLHVVNASVPNDCATAFVFWNGGPTVKVVQQFVSGGLTAITAIASSSVAVTNISGGITVQWAVHSIPL